MRDEIVSKVYTAAQKGLHTTTSRSTHNHKVVKTPPQKSRHLRRKKGIQTTAEKSRHHDGGLVGTIIEKSRYHQ